MLRRSIVLALVASAVVVPGAATARYEPAASLGRAPVGAFVEPAALAVDPAGNRVALHDAALGRLVVTFGAGPPELVLGTREPRAIDPGSPFDMAMALDGTLFVAQGSALRRIRLDGTITSKFFVGAPSGRFFTSIAVNAEGTRVVALDPVRKLVDVFDADLTFLGALPAPPTALDVPHDIAVNRGRIAVLDTGAPKRIALFDLATRAFQRDIGAPAGFTLTGGSIHVGLTNGGEVVLHDASRVGVLDAATGSERRLFSVPPGSTTTVAGDGIFVVDRIGERPVRLHALGDGALVGGLHRRADAPGEIANPTDVTFLADGRVAVADTFTKRIDITPLDGSPVQRVAAGSVNFLDGVDQAPDGTLVASDFTALRRFSLAGAPLAPVSNPALPIGGRFTILPDGRSVGLKSSTVQAFDAAGNEAGLRFGSPGPGATQYGAVSSIAPTPSGGMLVADPDRDRVQVYDASGAYVRTLSGAGGDPFGFPQWVAADARGNVYVADTQQGLVQKFRPDGTFLTRIGRFGRGLDADAYQLLAIPNGNALLDVSPAGDVAFVDTGARRLLVFRAVGPQTTITDGPAGRTADSTPSFTFAAEPAAGGFECALDGGAFRACGTPLTLDVLPDGEHRLQVRAVDTVDTVDGSPAERRFVVDTRAPAVTFGDAPSGTIASRSATFAFSADEAEASSECSLDGAAFAACTSPATFDGLADGEHRVQVRATDAAGNTGAPAERAFTVAVPAPSSNSAGSGAAGAGTAPTTTGTATGGSTSPSPAARAVLGVARTLRLDRRGRVLVRLTCAGAPCRGALELRDGRRVVARGRFALVAGGRAVVPVRLTKAAAAKLRRTRRLRLVLVAGPQRTPVLVRR